MKVRVNIYMNNLKGTVTEMYRNFSMTFASIILVTLTSLVVGFVLIISLNINNFTEQALESLNIYAYVEREATTADITKVEREISRIEQVNTIEFSSKEEELLLLAGDDKESDLINFFSGDANPLNDLYIITIKDENYDMLAISMEIEAMEHIEYVSYGDESETDKFISSMFFIQNISIAVAILLIIVSVFIIINTIKLTISSRKKEIEIMRLVGATKMYIRIPFMMEGLIIGFIGGVLSFIILIIAYSNGVNSEVFLTIQNSLLSVEEVLKYLIVLLPLGGMIIGGFGSFLATLRFLNK
ncbi:MAG: ABC transporter permease [Spiroplasma sp.]|nr:ABC transporter permease [Mycoplasmatales bacterium]